MSSSVVLTNTHRGQYYVLENDFLSSMFIAGWHFEEHILSRILPVLGSLKTRNVIDIGANFGIHTVPYAKQAGGTVHAFEPQEIIHELLLMNIQRNKCRNVIPYRYALGHEDGIATTLGNQYELHNEVKSLEDPLRFHNYGGIGFGLGGEPVVMRTLDSFRITNVGLIKIDVEGAERLVLAGAENTIRVERPYVVYEQHDMRPGTIFAERWNGICDMYAVPPCIRNTTVSDLFLDVYRYRAIRRLDEVNFLAIPE